MGLEKTMAVGIMRRMDARIFTDEESLILGH